MEDRKIFKRSIELAGRELTIEIGRMATQANGSVFLTYGETTILATATMSKTASEGIDFFPLTVDFVEKMFAAGKIPGGFFKREAKPTTKATLTARMIDRSIRPLFPEGFRNQVHIIITTLSFDDVNDPAFMGLLGASLALSISDIPFSGPIASARVGIMENEISVNPYLSALKTSDLDLFITGSDKSVVMIESGANEVSEEQMMESITEGHAFIRKQIEFQNEIISEVGKPKVEVELEEIPKDMFREMNDKYAEQIIEAAKIHKKQERDDRLDELKEEILESYQESLGEEAYEEQEKILKKSFNELVYNYFRKAVIEEEIRPDGRGYDDIRPIACEIDVLPRVHGSALFTRGETQSIGTVTLGSDSDEQIVDGLEEEYKKPYFLHYNFPPFCVGEAGFLRPPGRRELGHGALAERALDAVMPTKEEFPYTIRMVSDILESNGSSSMATVCSGSLALMAAGVPIKKMVAGVANGLVVADDKIIVLSDITGMEDHLGDMDFKVTGTRKGITAMQMDLKVEGIGIEVMTVALEKAKNSRNHILDIMEKVISKPREELSQHAPRIESFKIAGDKIGTVIGPGGKMIKSIIEETKVSININDDGLVSISSSDAEAIEKAKEIISSLVDEPEMGEIYRGKVSRIEPFGIFVKFMGGHKEGLVHISEISFARVDKVENLVDLGDELSVKYTGLDRGKIKLTMKGVPDNEELQEKIKNAPPSSERKDYQQGDRNKSRGSYNRDRGRRDYRDKRDRS